MEIIANIYNDFTSKFGIPRQSGLVDNESLIVFTPEFRNAHALRGMEEFSHLWLIWEFSENKACGYSPTVRPPRLGGNERRGVFATRSPFRPNPIGLSCVELKSITLESDHGPLLHVCGADLMDSTPIYDIKPYIYADCIPQAKSGFAQAAKNHILEVVFPTHLLAFVDASKRETIKNVLALDPRPSYQNDPQRIYGMEFAGLDIRFTVNDSCLTVVDVVTATV